MSLPGGWSGLRLEGKEKETLAPVLQNVIGFTHPLEAGLEQCRQHMEAAVTCLKTPGGGEEASVVPRTTAPCAASRLALSRCLRPFFCRGEMVLRMEACELGESFKTASRGRPKGAPEVADEIAAEASADCALAHVYQLECERNLDALDPLRLYELDQWRLAVRRGDSSLPPRPLPWPARSIFREPIYPTPADTPTGPRAPPQPWFQS